MKCLGLARGVLEVVLELSPGKRCRLPLKKGGSENFSGISEATRFSHFKVNGSNAIARSPAKMQGASGTPANGHDP